MKLSLNIKSRLAIWYLLIVALILVFFSLFTYLILNRGLYDMAQTNSQMTVIPLPEGPRPAQSGSDGIITPILAYTISSEWLAEMQAGAPATLPISTPQGLITFDQMSYITPEMKGEQRVQIFWRAAASGPPAAELLVITRPISEVSEGLDAYTGALYYVIPITAVLAAALGFFLIWRMLKPVNTISRTAREIEESDLDRRIDVKTEDELGRLAATLNQTFERLQQAFQRERQFTADASHELRTPLAILQSETSLSLSKNRNPEEYRRSLELISDEISRMTSMVNKLLVLARADNGADNLNLKNVNLNELLTDLVTDMEALGEDKSLHFELDLQDQLRVRGDEIKLRELFVNLLSNAIRYTPSGGRITVSLFRDAGNAKVSVTDTGIGIPEEHLPHIFERFYRVNKSHSLEESGSGLGLAIAKHITEQHGGVITVNSRIGQGSTFTVVLPEA